MNNLFSPVTNGRVGVVIMCHNGLRGVWDYLSAFDNDTEDIERLSIEPIASNLDAVPWGEDDGAAFTVYAHYKNGTINEMGMCNFFESPYEVERPKDVVAIARKVVHKNVQTAMIWAAVCGWNAAMAMWDAAKGSWAGSGIMCAAALACFWLCRDNYKKVTNNTQCVADIARTDTALQHLRQHLNLLTKAWK